jgi:hypothetical protein
LPLLLTKPIHPDSGGKNRLTVDYSQNFNRLDRDLNGKVSQVWATSCQVETPDASALGVAAQYLNGTAYNVTALFSAGCCPVSTTSMPRGSSPTSPSAPTAPSTLTFKG